MFIDIKGKSVKTPRFLVKKAAIFFGEYLLGKRLSENVYVFIEFDKHEDMDDDYAYCDMLEENCRSFVVTIDRSLSKKDTLLALAHEFVHVKQYAKGELKDLSRPARMTKWKGQKYMSEDINYWDLPWEQEAYKREKTLYNLFMKKMKENDSL